MAGKNNMLISKAAGVVIILADLYWTYTSYWNRQWLALGIIIFIASIVWLYFDFA